MSENVTFDKDKSTLGYSFEVPDTMEGMEEDTYEVTVAFKLPNWDKRVVNVMLEGSTVATDISLEQNSWVSRTFTTKVTDIECACKSAEKNIDKTRSDSQLYQGACRERHRTGYSELYIIYRCCR